MESGQVLEIAKDAGGGRILEALLSSDVSAKRKYKIIAKYALETKPRICWLDFLIVLVSSIYVDTFILTQSYVFVLSLSWKDCPCSDELRNPILMIMIAITAGIIKTSHFALFDVTDGTTFT
jgi:hypothetical protein